MTTQEVLTSIISSAPSGKWYNVSDNEKECTRLRVTALRILAGTCKPKTMREFFSKFGYEQNEVTWKKLP